MSDRTTGQCFKCESRDCKHRIVCHARGFDEVACYEHSRDLEEYADRVLGGWPRSHITSSECVRRGTPHP